MGKTEDAIAEISADSKFLGGGELEWGNSIESRLFMNRNLM